MIVKSDIISILNSALKQKGVLRKSDTQLLFDCPICNRNDGMRKLEICIDGEQMGNSHCWRCNFKSRTFGSLLFKLNAPISLKEKLTSITGEIKQYKKIGKFTDRNDVPLTLPDEFRPLYDSYDSLDYKHAIKYLKGRNIVIDDIIRYNIGYCEDGEYKNHIIIPSYDYKNNLNFFIGREYYNKDGLYRYKKPDRDTNIIGFENLINWNYGEVSLCEGAFDAMAIRQNAIPLFGKYISSKIIEKLTEYKIKKINMVLDNDAIDDAVKNWEILHKNGLEMNLVILEDKDPSKLGFVKTHELIKNSIKFNWDQLMRYRLSKI